jgi:pimeloyl-ACP methyl ester carboxylesterase
MPDLPLHLCPVPPTTASARTSVGFSSRTLVGVGHSLGGVSTAWAALYAPALFAGLVLLDPVIERSGAPAIGTLLAGAVRRRTHWPSREEARAVLAANPFFGAWAPAVLDGYVAHGMCPAADGGVRLKMGGMLEAAVFADYWSGDDVFRRMPALDARVALRWLMPDVGRSWFRADSEGKYAQRRVWLRPGNSSNVIVPGAGHLVRDSSVCHPDSLTGVWVQLAQEAPDEIGAYFCARDWTALTGTCRTIDC